MDISSPLVCDAVTGICALPEQRASKDAPIHNPGSRPVHIVYFTDPMSSTCWEVEPQLRRLHLEYGQNFDIAYHAGDSHAFSPSVAFKAAQLQDEVNALAFLRKIREMVFVELKDVIHHELIAQTARHCELDPVRLLNDMDGPAKHLFESDLALASRYNVRGVPTFFLTDNNDNCVKIYGHKPYSQFESALLSLYPEAIRKKIDANYKKIFSVYPTLTTVEYGLITNQSREDAHKELTALFEQHRLERFTSPKEVLWSIKK